MIDALFLEFYVERAAESDSLELVRWLVDEHNCPVISSVLRSAAEYGRLETLQWLDGQGDGDELEQVVPDAARGGHLHVLEWLMEQGCALTEDVMYEAAESSTVATVAWLLDHGCPFDEETLVARSCAHSTGDIFKFLVETKRMQYDPQECKYEAMKHDWFTDTVLRNVADVPLRTGYLSHRVCSGDLGRVRSALEQEAPLDLDALCSMIGDEEYAMLYEALNHCSFQGKLTEECRASIDDALRLTGHPSLEVVQVLADFGYQVPEGKWMRLEDEAVSIFILPRSRRRAREAGGP